jgi:hypothetical protein
MLKLPKLRGFLMIQTTAEEDVPDINTKIRRKAFVLWPPKM